MKALVAALFAGSAFTFVAYAEDQPIIAPPPSWVKPTSLPASPNTDDQSPVRILLSDQQIQLERGKETVYSNVAVKIQTPQGLAAGNLSFPWRPDTDVLTVHKLQIQRGGKVIDVLAAGQTFTVVRREQNLENATLDGVLTANIQPEGLQVGDIIEFAMSLSSSDPTLQGHVEQIAGNWNGFAVDRAHLRIQWPASIPVRLRQTGSLPEIKVRKSGDTSIAELLLDKVEPVIPPKGAPLRYQIGRLVEATDYASWADIGTLMAPLYDKAATLPAEGSLRTELDRIKNLSIDPKIRAQAALALVQDRVRYVALTMGAGGYVPANAETTWSRRYGDCKGKSALLLALLHGLDIPAEPVAVSTTFGDGLDARLPIVGLFNHVIVRATVAGQTYWMDGTRIGDTALDRLQVPNFGWGLPLVAKGAALTRMLPVPLSTPTHDTSIRIDASAGISAPAPTTVETILRGDEAISINAGLANLTTAARDQALKAYWRNQYDFIEVKSSSASFDAKTGEQRLTMEGTAKLDWANGNYQTDGTNVGYRADFSRDPEIDKDAPFAVPYPYFTRVRETIILPKAVGDFKLGTNMEVDQKAGGIEYRRHATIENGIFVIEKTERSVIPEFPAKDAQAEQAALRTLADKNATLRMPASYVYTGKDIASVRAEVPTTSSGYVGRAKAFINRDMRKEALLDYDKAIELDPANVYAWSNRAITRIQVGDLVGARADLEKSESIDPEFVQNFIGEGMLADVERHPGAAIGAYTKALAKEPNNDYALEHRARAYHALGNTDKALADFSTAIESDKDDARGYVTRGNYYLDLRRYDEAIADFNRASAIDPTNEWAIANRAMANVWKQDRDAATKDLETAAKINPQNPVISRARGLLAQQKGDAAAAISAYSESLKAEPGNGFTLGHRAQANMMAGNLDAALTDAAAALTLQPKWIDLYLLRANIYRRRGDLKATALEADQAISKNPDDAHAYVVAANIYSVTNRDADAMKAFDRAIAIKPEAYIYLNRGLRRPRKDLAGRNADIDAALDLDPKNAEALVAKAQLQEEGNNFIGAIANYTDALANSAKDSSLLVSRGIAYARSGDTDRAEADFSAARKNASDPVIFNSMCWSKATAGVSLESGLSDCNEALKGRPDEASFLDSRGLVLLRLGRNDEAIADYDRALAKNLNIPSSLWGRSIAWARNGNLAKAKADEDAALKIAPNIKADFDRYGITQ
jgi:tetratricopeptide (TPR) repeat protein